MTIVSAGAAAVGAAGLEAGAGAGAGGGAGVGDGVGALGISMLPGLGTEACASETALAASDIAESISAPARSLIWLERFAPPRPSAARA